MGVLSESHKPQVVGSSRGQRQRLKREDSTHVKHDKCFSDWKVLVGPSDWKEHASGKIADRFRVGNLPGSCVGPGLYELGVTPPAWLPPQRNSHSGFLRPQDVVVVYLGYADNVYQHLQRYGQAGAHLEGARSTRLFSIKNEMAGSGWKPELLNPEERSISTDEGHLSLDRGADEVRMSTESWPTSNASFDGIDEARPIIDGRRQNVVVPMSPDRVGSRSPRGPRLFSEVFALGCSIAFRWAVTDSKAVAERVESELIEVFDYAWKRGGNFRQRSPDILAKIVMGGALGSKDSSYGCFGRGSRRRCIFFNRKRVGIRIAARKPLEYGSRMSSRLDRSRVSDFFMLLKNSPHLLTVGGKSAKNCKFTKLDIPVDRCGVILENGLPCSALPVKGRKRCLVHTDMKKRSQRKPIRVAHTSQHMPAHEASWVVLRETQVKHRAEPSATPSSKPTSSCFPLLAPVPAPSWASPQEPKRRGSLSFNSWLRTSELRMARSREWAEMSEAGMRSPRLSAEGGRRSASYNSTLSTCKESQNESPSRREICGLRLNDGTVCPAVPRPNRKRCSAHKGLRNQAPRSPKNNPTKGFS